MRGLRSPDGRRGDELCDDAHRVCEGQGISLKSSARF